MGKGEESVDPLWSAPDSGRLGSDHLLFEPADLIPAVPPIPSQADARFLTAGESHGPGLVATVEGLPAGLAGVE